MENNLQFDQVAPLLEGAKQISIVLAQKTNVDRVAAGLALSLALAKKQTTVYCSRPMTVEFSSLVGVDRIKNKFEGKNLTIAFDYAEGSIEKVSYNIEGQKFNLTIQPKKGFAPLSADNLEYHYVGQEPDMIFVVGARRLTDLGEIYFENKEVFAKTPLTNLDASAENEKFGKINLVDPQAGSFSELVALLIDQLKLPVDADIASNLLAGIKDATVNFSLAQTTPLSFEAAAFCLRHGAAKPMPATTSAQTPPAPPADWLEPKVYKGNTQV